AINCKPYVIPKSFERSGTDLIVVLYIELDSGILHGTAVYYRCTQTYKTRNLGSPEDIRGSLSIPIKGEGKAIKCGQIQTNIGNLGSFPRNKLIGQCRLRCSGGKIGIIERIVPGKAKNILIRIIPDILIAQFPIRPSHL